jgi:hypothetical protein
MADVSKSSDAPRRAALRALITLAGLIAASACGVATAASAGTPTSHAQQHAPGTTRLEGEFGLYVGFTRDSLIVRWLTAEAQSGQLEVVWEGGATVRASTPAGTAHRAAIARPRQTNALLRYGAGGATLHETAISLATPRRPPVEVRNVDSLYVVGDTHGYMDELITGLQGAGLIDADLRWSGGRRHLAFAGDLTDRGPDVMALLWFVYRLEQEAARAGGRVHVVLGNHETMVMMSDLRYVHEKEMAVADAHGLPYDRLLDIRETVLGRWLASKPALIRVDRALIVHGGVAPEFADLGLPGLDQLLARFIGEDLFYRWTERATLIDVNSTAFQAREDFFRHPRSLFWHRLYVQTDTAGAELNSVLRRLGADVLVVGHTAVPQIQTRYDGRLIAAHTPRHGAELLLLVRERGETRRYRVTGDGPPQPF